VQGSAQGVVVGEAVADGVRKAQPPLTDWKVGKLRVQDVARSAVMQRPSHDGHSPRPLQESGICATRALAKVLSSRALRSTHRGAP
jgi:hypothetical protein